MKVASRHVLYFMMLIMLIGSVYNFVDAIVFPEFTVGQCVQFKRIYKIPMKIVRKHGDLYDLRNKYGEITVSYNDLLNGFNVVECKKPSGFSGGEVWRITK